MSTGWWVIVCFVCLYGGAIVGMLVGAIIVPRIAAKHGIRQRTRFRS